MSQVMVEFRYHMSSRQNAELKGSVAMQALVSLPQGLTRKFPLATSHLFSGPHAAVSGVLPVPAIRKFVDQAQRAFGQDGFGDATVTVQPLVSVHGRLGGHVLKASYSPELAFSLNGDTMALGSGAFPSSGRDAAAILKPSKHGKVTYRTAVPNTVPLLVVHPSVTLAREIGFGLAGLCLLLGVFLARPLLRSGSDSEAVRIRTMYGAHLIEVRDLALKDGPVADVASMDSLADLAKKYESMIMHVRRQDGDAYLVWDNGMIYRYRPTAPAAPVTPAMEPGDLMTKPKTKKLNGVARR